MTTRVLSDASPASQSSGRRRLTGTPDPLASRSTTRGGPDGSGVSLPPAWQPGSSETTVWREPGGGGAGAAESPFAECHPPVVDADGAVAEAGHDEGAVGVTGQARHAAVGARGDVLGPSADPGEAPGCAAPQLPGPLGAPCESLSPGRGGRQRPDEPEGPLGATGTESGPQPPAAPEPQPGGQTPGNDWLWAPHFPSSSSSRRGRRRSFGPSRPLQAAMCAGDRRAAGGGAWLRQEQTQRAGWEIGAAKETLGAGLGTSPR